MKKEQGFVAVLAAVFIGLFALVAGWIGGSKAPTLLNGKSQSVPK